VGSINGAGVLPGGSVARGWEDMERAGPWLGPARDGATLLPNRAKAKTRLPLTSEQKALIDVATADEPEGKAAWARAILLAAAQERVAKGKTERANKKRISLSDFSVGSDEERTT
jgi:hypothetical protein